MADSSTIREVFIKAGFIVNEASHQAFDAALTRSTALGVVLGETLVGVAKTSINHFEQMAEGMEKLYFASKRTGATAAELTDFGLAIQNIGGSADAARASVEALAKFEATTYTGKAIAESLGANPNHNALDQLKEIVAYGKAHGEDFVTLYNIINGNLPGQDYLTLKGLYDGAKDTTAEDFQKKWGISFDDATEKAHEFESTLRSFGVVVEGAMIKPLELFINNSQKIFDIFKSIYADSAAIIQNAQTAANFLVDLYGRDPEKAHGEAQQYAGDAWSWTKDHLGTGWDILLGETKNGISTAFDGKTPNNLGQATIDARTRQAVAWFMSPEGGGLSYAGAIGMADQAIRESGNNEQAIGDDGDAMGAFQWHAQRRAEIMHAMGIDVAHASFQDNLRAATWELNHTEKASGDMLRAVQNPAQAIYDAAYFYERPKDKDRVALERAKDASNIMTTINVTVAAGSDGHTIGKTAAESYNTHSAIRNAQGAGVY